MDSRVFRRVWNTISYGLISIVNDGGKVQTAQVKVGPNIIRDNVPIVQLFGLSGNAPAGHDAVVLAVGGDSSNVIVIGTNHQASRPVNLLSGEIKLYSANGSFVHLSNAGIIVDAVNLPVTINNATTLTINASDKVRLNTPALEVTGSITSGVGTGDSVTLQHHTHGQGTDGHGDTEVETNAPTAGT